MNARLQKFHRRAVLPGLALVSGFAVFAVAAGAQSSRAGLPKATVYKSPSCGCCSKWVDHMKNAGFDVTAINVDDVDKVKREHGIPAGMDSCHTALIGNYVVEGHVPADVVQRMLREKPAIAGLAAPGMPPGSPGMEVPGYKAPPYSVMSFDKAGKTAVYEKR
jgi:hypothetical protein